MSKQLKDMYEEVVKCNKCGYCQAVCPIFRETKFEGSVSRGRNAMMRNSIEKKVEFNPALKEYLYECLLCGRCVENCPAGVPTTDILLTARETLAKNHVPLVQQLIFNNILPYPKRLTAANRLLRIYQNSGLRWVLKKSGLIGLLGPLAKSEDVIPKITPTFRDVESKLAPNPDSPKFNVSYFLGCGTNLLKPKQAVDAVNTLRKMGCRVEIPETFCCGLPAISYGQGDVARELAKRNIDFLLKENLDYIVSDCASCSSMLKDYYKLFDENDPYFERAKQIETKILDYAQLLLKCQVKKLFSGENHVVTYHVPCHLARGLKAGKEPRKILKSIEGINYVELPEADVCCGAAGSYYVTHPELSEQVLKRKMDNIRSTGADIVVTSCPACMMQLEHGARLFKVQVKVMHLSEIINWSGPKNQKNKL
ncbi:MAG: (Fe-S)-binding protein [Bacillota bacterium]|jgi:glycolate oxidase iron-sulfur subunit|nr:(Fe-S)-binding protein [Clostridia bacterium]